MRRAAAGAVGALQAGLVVVLGAAVTGCRAEESVETAGPELLHLDADQVIIGMEHFMTREGLRKAHLLADTAWFLQDSSVVRLRPVEVTFFDDEGQEISDLEARLGFYDMQTNEMEVRGDVVLRARQEFQRLETEHLTYDPRRDEVRSDSAFVLHRSDGVLRGTGLVSDPGLDTVRVARPAVVSENPPGSP